MEGLLKAIKKGGPVDLTVTGFGIASEEMGIQLTLTLEDEFVKSFEPIIFKIEIV